MGKRDPRIDAYIEKSADFARPILEHLRVVVHEACPDVEETMKWSFPHFMHHGILCSMASFKQHCAFGFWKARQMAGLGGNPETAMGDFGRIATLKDLPGKTELKRLIKQAMALNTNPPPVLAKPKPKRVAKPELVAPDAFLEALAKNKKAKASFDAFSPSHRREYVEWILEAKREETVSKRIEESVRMLSEGKPRHWKYINC
ncbi:MAG TPA: YdeI/OmpD-associated family protein [Arenimonas sp.]|nr:YdeI/OmpD-associated family protein [Arenimonas sp.]HOZ04258.1 YdeI/OmpD-associated family protein [Arenimonas sp.]HPO24394.1 YdeI/OmpD-associated family protein [Arenimonas sp.]HPW31396.1 YdeI/OmpD-associated family protein [Arenimonas sp.]